MKRSVYVTFFVMLAIIIVGVIYIFFFLDPSEKQKRNETPAATALLPDEGIPQFTNLAGEPAPLDESFGKVLVVFSWASWCPQCGDDMKRINELAQEFSTEETEFILLNRGEDKYSAERYLATIGELPHVTMRLDSSDYFYSRAEGYAMPELIVYGKEGEIVLHQRGQVQFDELRNTLKNSPE